METEPLAGVQSAAALTQSVLAEDDHFDEVLDDDQPPDLADDLAPERSGGPLALGSRGGLMGLMLAVAMVDDLAAAIFVTLAPEIQATLDLSDSLIAVTSQLGPLVLALSALPLALSGDRGRRVHTAAAMSVVGGLAALAAGAARSGWPLGAARLATGAARGGEVAQHSLMADAVPLHQRGRAFGLLRAATGAGLIVGAPVAVFLADLAGGPAGWRWAFVAVGVVAAGVGVLAWRADEPEPGAEELTRVLGETDLPPDETPGFVTSFVQLRRIRSFSFLGAPLAASGFVLFGFPVFASKFLADEFGLSASGRAYAFAAAGVGVLAGAILAGWWADRLENRPPERLARASAACVAAAALGAVGVAAPNETVFAVVVAVSQGLASAALVLLLVQVATFTPAHLRTQGMALAAVYIYGLGAFLGATLVGAAGSLEDGYAGPLVVVTVVATLVASVVAQVGATSVRRDVSSVVSSIRGRDAEARRVAAGGSSAVIQVSDLDFSYGQLQVLFDVNVDVQSGEVLALLGTNGAGKSTLLKVISGLGMPSRGAVRLDGRDITYTEAEERVRWGIVQVPGGKAVFPTLSVRENLTVGAYTYIREKQRVRERTDHVLELFPKLAERIDQPAGSMSGGEQQMLAIAKGLLLDPKVLCIDELSLGLAPVVVQEILEVIEGLKEQGITMVIVEQSVNVALSISDRAIFMEKGRVRFQGPANELMERGDLVRAVFLGGEGG